jgi:AcrR family transcriptional regulator
MTDSDTTRERLLRVAGQVFAEKEFEAATIREIKNRAGTNIAAVNYHFGDKERLYIESVKYAHGTVSGAMSVPSWPENTPAASKLRQFIQMYVTRLLDESRPAWHSQLIMRELAQPSAACFEIVRDNLRPVAKVLEGILGELVPLEMPRWKRYMIACSIITKCIHYCQNRPVNELLVGEQDHKHFTPSNLAEHIADFSLAALGLGEPMIQPPVQT